MKKIYLLLLINACSIIILPAQVEYTARSFDLDSSVITIEEIKYTARDNIILSPGFYGYTMAGQIYFNIDEEMILPITSSEYVDPETVTSRTIDKELEFGSLPGSFNVGSNGAGNYTIPIYIPPGLNTMSPSLSVFYNSSLPDGLLGTGWGLSGTSTIHRVSKNMHYDSTVLGIQLDTSDILALDGNRLVLKSGNYGSDSSKYATYFESYQEVEAYGTTGNGPSYFKVTANNGMVFEYGNSTDSKVELDNTTTILAWKLNKVTDPNGNYITYSYDNSKSGQAYLTSIKYTGNASADLEPYNEIKILYQEREDFQTTYLKGNTLKDSYLVRKIQSYGYGKKLREYEFNYAFNRRTYLSEIIEKNEFDEQYNSTIVGWNDFADKIVCNQATFEYPEIFGIGDFNNDGDDDYVAISDYDTKFTLKLFLNDGYDNYPQSPTDSVQILKEFVELLVSDMDNDGRSEAVAILVDTCYWTDSIARIDDTYFPPETTYTYFQRHEEYYNANFFEFNSDTLGLFDEIGTETTCNGGVNIPLPFTYAPNLAYQFFADDIDGDGYSDYAVLDDDGFIAYGNSQGPPYSKTSTDFPASGDENVYGDFTGNGTLDLGIYKDSIFSVYTIQSNVYSKADSTIIPNVFDRIWVFNRDDDSKADISYRKAGEFKYYRLRQTSGFSSEYAYVDEGYRKFGDFNHDGYNDFVVIEEDEDTVKFEIQIFNNDGEGYFSSSADDSLTIFNDYIDHFVGDFDGDDISDIAIVCKDMCQEYQVTEYYYKFYFISGDDLSILDSASTPNTCANPTNKPLPFSYSRTGPNRFFVVDQNRDGISDFLVLDDEGLIIYGNSDGDDFDVVNVTFPSSGESNHISDFTGNGIPDLGIFSHNHYKRYELDGISWSLIDSTQLNGVGGSIQIADFNGDGITDLSYRTVTGVGYYRYGTGTGFSNQYRSYEYDEAIYTYEMILDFDGDGRDDIVGLAIKEELPEDGWDLIFLESVGNNKFEHTITAEIGYDYSFENTDVADINGDGMVDLCMLNKDRIFSFSPNDKHDLVAFIENGVGQRTNIEYNNLNAMKDTSYFQSGTYSFPMNSLNVPLTVVESYEVTSSLHNDASITKSSYKYTDAVAHKQGLGFLGFSKTETKTDSVHSTKAYNSFTAPDYYASMDSVQRLYTGNLISSSAGNKKYFTTTISGGKTYRIYSDSQSFIDYLNGNTTTIEPVIDTTSGNLTSTKTTFHDNSYTEVLYYDYLKNGSSFPQKIVKRQKHRDDSNVFSSETRITYDTTKFYPTEIIENYGKSTESTIELKNYNAYGIPTRTELTPINLTEQVVTSTYDHTGRFLLSRSNSLGTVGYGYDTIRGRLLYQEDMYDNTVHYSYNKWGAAVKTLPSVGLATTKSVQWAGASDPTGTLYSVLTQDSLATYSKQYIDYKGRAFKSENEGFGEDIYYTDKRFNVLNQADSISNIYKSGGTTNWNSFTYRTNDGRISNESYHGGASVSYIYNSNEIIKSVNSKSYTSSFDAMGNITSVEDPLNLELDYTYYSSGGFKSILGNGGTMSYYFNDAGLDTMMVDPAHGTSRKSYNSLGQVTWSKDGKGNEFDFTYDTINRLTRMENSNNSSEYYSISYISSGNGKGQVYQKIYTDGSLTTTLTYSYDSIGRISTESKQIGAKTYSLTYHYSDIGRLDSISDSNGKSFSYTYDSKSFLTKIYFEGSKIWELESSDLTERKVKLGSNITLTTSFDDVGQVSDIEAGNLFDMSFSFNDTTGSLINRTQRIFNLSGTCTDTLSESFTYDDLDRLLKIRGPNDTLEVSYDTSKKERISSKSDAGELYEYDQSNPFLLESIDTATSTLVNRPNQSITYTSFNKVDSISEGNYLITFDYGPNQERVKMKVERNDTLQYTRYYFGSYELTEYPGGNYEKDTWFTADGGLIGFNRVTNSTDSIYYILKDHLGSVMTVAGEDGNAREFFSYDAWGRRRVADDWTYDTTLTVDYTSRGYTGHEHMDETWLINMNGRVYDPLVGLFLSPDPFVQTPMNPLNYNRYTYVLNNPLKYTDPSGYKFVNIDPEDEAMYYQMQIIIDDWNFRNQNHGIPEGVRKSGGGGSGGIGGYTYFNGQYYYEGQPVPEVEARLFAIEPNSSMSISYLEARYFMIDKSTAWATFYYEKSSGNGKSIIDYLQNQEVDPKRINPYNGPVVDQILDWMEYIYKHSPNDLFLTQVVSSSLFKNPFNGEPSNLSKKEGNIKYFITNPLTSTVYYERWPIVEVIYNPNENSISIFLQATDTRQYRGSRVIYIQSNDADLIWDYWENIKN